MRANREFRAYLISLGSPPVLSGLDMVAGTLWGISGIIEERALIRPDVVHEMVNHVSFNRRQRRALLIGQPSVAVQSITELIDCWKTDLDGSDILELACFRACLALAQLPTLQPVMMSAGAAHYMQSLDRIHRRGQSHNVTYYVLLARDTIEEKEFVRLQQKEEDSRSLLGDSYTPPITRKRLLFELGEADSAVDFPSRK